MNRHFFQRWCVNDKQVYEKVVNVSIREVQIKITIKYHLTLVGWLTEPGSPALQVNSLPLSHLGSLAWLLLCWVASVVSDPVRPHRRQPTRLPRPWGSPGKNTGVGCHCLLQRVKVKSESEVAQSCPTLSDLMDCSLPGSSVHGIFQARVLEWDAIVFSLAWLLSTKKKERERETITCVGECVEKWEPLCTIHRIINWCNPYGKRCRGSLKNEK